MAVGTGVRIAVGTGVKVSVGVAESVSVTVGSGVRVAVGTTVNAGEGVGDGNGVSVATLRPTCGTGLSSGDVSAVQAHTETRAAATTTTILNAQNVISLIDHIDAYYPTPNSYNPKCKSNPTRNKYPNNHNFIHHSKHQTPKHSLTPDKSTPPVTPPKTRTNQSLTRY